MRAEYVIESTRDLASDHVAPVDAAALERLGFARSGESVYARDNGCYALTLDVAERSARRVHTCPTRIDVVPWPASVADLRRLLH